MMGTALGGVAYAEDQLGAFLAQGIRGVDQTLALTVFGGASSMQHRKHPRDSGVTGPQLDERDELRVRHHRDR
jgi:3-oxoacyl-[acyl-carrier-protein] synthase II